MEYMTRYDNVGNIDGNVYAWRGNTSILLQDNLDGFELVKNGKQDTLLRFVELKRVY